MTVCQAQSQAQGGDRAKVSPSVGDTFAQGVILSAKGDGSGRRGRSPLAGATMCPRLQQAFYPAPREQGHMQLWPLLRLS